MSKLVVTSEVCNVFNDRIAKLGVNGSVDVQDFVGNKFTKKALAVCNALLEELAKHDNHIKLIPNYKNACEIVQAVKHRSLLFNETSTSLQYKIIDYLISQVQAARLIYHKKQSEMVIDEHDVDIGEIDTSMDVVYDDCIDTIERSKVAFQLDKICKLLQLGVPGDADEHVILHTLVSYIRDKIQHCPDLLSNGPGLILRDVGELSPQQTAKLNSVEELLFKDFELRRHMLMKRMEVTIESFLWSDKASSKEEEIRAAVRAQQAHLTASPVRYTLEHARTANVALVHEQRKKVTGDSQIAFGGSGGAGGGSAVKSIIKQILVGAVPDRGGRANEVRTKQLKADVRRSFGNNNNSNNYVSKGGGGNSRGGGAGEQPVEKLSTPSTSTPIENTKVPSANSKSIASGDSRANAGKGKGGGAGNTVGGGNSTTAAQGGKKNANAATGSVGSAGSGGGNRNSTKSGDMSTSAPASAASGRKVSLEVAEDGGGGDVHKAKRKRNRHRGGGGGGGGQNS